MGYSQHPNLLVNDAVDDGVGEVPHEQAPLSMKPRSADKGMLEKQGDRMFKIDKKRLGEGGARSFPIIRSRFPKAGFRLRV